jgi:predicted  nucleic acid-binding Zn-ribbon protein
VCHTSCAAKRDEKISEYIEFAVTDEKRFEDLQKVFNKLKNSIASFANALSEVSSELQPS